MSSAVSRSGRRGARKFLVRLALPILLLAGALVLAWQFAVSRLESELGLWEAQLRKSGWQVEHLSASRSGFPFTARLVVPRVHVSGGTATVPGGLDWTVDRLTLAVSPLRPFRLALMPDGYETLRISGLPAAAFTADELAASVPIGRGRPDHVDLAASNLAGGLASAARRQDVRIDTLRLSARLEAPPHDAPWGHDAGAFTLAAASIVLPDTRQWPLGARVATVSLEADFVSPLLGGGDPRAEAAAWHAGRGVVRIKECRLRWGPLDARAHASFALDDALQPAGTGEADIAGHAAALDALAKGGAIPEGLATTVEAVLSLMATPSPDHGAATGAVRLPFTVKSSTLSVGHIPVAKFGRIEWGTHE